MPASVAVKRVYLNVLNACSKRPFIPATLEVRIDAGIDMTKRGWNMGSGK